MVKLVSWAYNNKHGGACIKVLPIDRKKIDTQKAPRLDVGPNLAKKAKSFIVQPQRLQFSGRGRRRGVIPQINPQVEGRGTSSPEIQIMP